MSDKYTIPTLPLKQDVETKPVLKRVAAAHRRLAELKGVARTIPNEQILINTLNCGALVVQVVFKLKVHAVSLLTGRLNKINRKNINQLNQ